MNKVKIILVAFFLSTLQIFSQDFDHLYYALPDLQTEQELAYTFPLFGSGGTLKILQVYCKFSDDNFNLSPNTDAWPSTLNTMPMWASSFLSQTVQNDYYDPSFSGYFQDMSRNQFQVIGDVRFYQPLHEQSYYFIANGRHIGYLVQEILLGIDNSVNYADYDQWDPLDFDRDGIKNEPDGKVDFIAICFRFANTKELDGTKYNGIAGITGYKQKFGDNSMQMILDGKIIDASILGSGTFQDNVISPENGLQVMSHELGHYLFGLVHYEGIGYHGLMDGWGSGVMSSYERYKLGWIQPIPVQANAFDENLTDAITTGKVYKLNINASSYFLIDNHQRISYYESTLKRYNGGPLTSPGTGVLITHCTSSTVDVESAFGKWNWKKLSGIYLYPFEVETVNRIGGEDKLNLRRKNTIAGTMQHPDYLGAPDDYMNPGFLEIFSPWSNPSTYPDASNICVELTSIDENKIAHLNIYTQNAVQQAPSKPQNFRRIANVNNHPQIAWELNIEPDISSYRIYRSYNNSSFSWVNNVNHPANTFVDNEIIFSKPIWEKTVKYYVVAVDNTNKTSIPSDQVSLSGQEVLLPKDNSNENVNSKDLVVENSLASNYPNPFNPTTLLNYSVKEAV